MMRSLITLAASSLLLALVHAQGDCGGKIQSTSNGTLGAFTVAYYDTFTHIKINPPNGNLYVPPKDYIIICGSNTAEQVSPTLPSYGITSSPNIFKAPVQNVAVGGTYSSSYIELVGHIDAIKLLYHPNDVVSPCLQQRFQNNATQPLADDFSQYTTNNIDAGFRQINTYEPKDIFIPTENDVDPLERIEFITAISLFFNDGVKGEQVYNAIKTAYSTLQRNMDQIPKENRQRIAWLYYDPTFSTWILRNNRFTRAMIAAAGGISFPLAGEVQSDFNHLTLDQAQTILRNSQIVIDETNYALAGKENVSPIETWRTLAGFASASDLKVLMDKKVFSLDNSVSVNGTSDFNYRLPSRPDLFLKDLIYVQYPTFFGNTYNVTFINQYFSYGSSGAKRYSAANCTATSTYNSGDIATVDFKPEFTGNPTPPPPLVGQDPAYGAGESGGQNGASKGSSKMGIIVGVVCVAAVLGAAFAFVFFRWSKRAKEDRFIELEEEMNNEIPLH
ncbi:hypothetical protein B0O80DRAFT_459655 [Mortierella sp. GBAus27b]|nr:hypothetical protein B0O80DRAFT_459655 [Mortierella sp. GBAus27b]